MARCSTCNSAVVEFDSAQGQSYCAGCGTVLEENEIVSEITFGESSGGAAIVQGSFVAADALRTRASGPYGNRGSAESREVAIANGRKRIKQLAQGMKLSDRLSEAAQRWFNLAVSTNFVKGRKSGYVIAACLYITCRMEKTHHMLIDFSDMLQVNVFVLGSTYLKLVQVLHIKSLPIMDPSLYISRFAALLEFKDETQKVATDAVRLVQRFKRDWMDTGRRPAGICGACLLLAARMNNFRRSMQEIVQVVKIADVTLKKRLEEFRQTASGDLSIQDFRTMWLEETANPPAYTNGLKPKKSKAKSKNRLKELRGVVSDEEERSELGMQDEKEDGESVAPSTPRGSTPGASPAPSSRSRKGKERAREESEQPIVFQSPRSPGSTYSRRSETPNPDAVFQAATDFNAETSDNEDEDDDDQAPSSSRNAHLVARSTPVRSQSGSVSPPPCRLGFSRRTRTPSIQPAGSEKEDEEIDEEEDTFVDTAVADEVSTFLHTTEAEGLTSELNEADRQAAERRAMEIEGRELEGLDEDELDCFLLTEDEVKIKTRVWMEFNKDYLEKLALKEAKAQGEAQGDNPPKKKRKRKNDAAGPPVRATNPAEAARSLAQQKKFSKKINYKSFDNLFNNEDLPQRMNERLLRGSTVPREDDVVAEGSGSAAPAALDDEKEDDETDDLMREVIEEDDAIAGPSGTSHAQLDDDEDEEEEDADVDGARRRRKRRKGGAAVEDEFLQLTQRGGAGSDEEDLFEEI